MIPMTKEELERLGWHIATDGSMDFNYQTRFLEYGKDGLTDKYITYRYDFEQKGVIETRHNIPSILRGSK